jgi:hypothetical protein
MNYSERREYRRTGPTRRRARRSKDESHRSLALVNPKFGRETPL